jgi:hypothetical protein
VASREEQLTHEQVLAAAKQDSGPLSIDGELTISLSGCALACQPAPSANVWPNAAAVRAACCRAAEAWGNLTTSTLGPVYACRCTRLYTVPRVSRLSLPAASIQLWCPTSLHTYTNTPLLYLAGWVPPNVPMQPPPPQPPAAGSVDTDKAASTAGHPSTQPEEGPSTATAEGVAEAAELPAGQLAAEAAASGGGAAVGGSSSASEGSGSSESEGDDDDDGPQTFESFF